MTGGSKVLDRLGAFALGGVDHENKVAATDRRWIEVARRAAHSNCTLLVTGETGVGKEYLARWIHTNSKRAHKAFVPVNCGAIPESLIDSQLFGHIRGAFTGAVSDQLGLVRAAEGGTLFLDEVSELPLTAQNRLLRLLQEQEAQPVGRSQPVKVDVRVVAASNRDLVEAVGESMFREDLLFRLDVIHLRVKALRERVHELPVLLDRFNGEFAAMYEQPKLEFDRQALSFLSSYRWPGNVRQVRSMVERLHVLCPKRRVNVPALLEFGQFRQHADAGTPGTSMQHVKREAVKRVLDDAGGSATRAATVFGVHRSTIYRWLKEG